MSRFCIAAFLLMGFPLAARAELIIQFSEAGGGVVVDANGSLDISALLSVTAGSTTLGSTFVDPDSARVFLGGDGSVAATRYRIIAGGPDSFGVGDTTIADSSSGDRLAIVGDSLGSESELVLPSDYISGSMLSSSATFNGESFASLGLSEGTYAYSWGTGASADSLTVHVSSVPEPSCLALLFTLTSGGIISRRRRRAGV